MSNNQLSRKPTGVVCREVSMHSTDGVSDKIYCLYIYHTTDRGGTSMYDLWAKWGPRRSDVHRMIHKYSSPFRSDADSEMERKIVQQTANKKGKRYRVLSDSMATEPEDRVNLFVKPDDGLAVDCRFEILSNGKVLPESYPVTHLNMQDKGACAGVVWWNVDSVDDSKVVRLRERMANVMKDGRGLFTIDSGEAFEVLLSRNQTLWDDILRGSAIGGSMPFSSDAGYARLPFSGKVVQEFPSREDVKFSSKVELLQRYGRGRRRKRLLEVL